MKIRADDQAVRAFQAVVHQGVGEHQAEHARVKRQPPAPLAPERERGREGGGQDQHQHARGVGAALRLHVAPNISVITTSTANSTSTSGRESAAQRGAMPKRGRIAGNQLEQPCHGGRAGESEDQNRREVVDGAEAAAKVFVCQEGDGAPARLPARR